jgi:diacylglycerol kinase family enzyme
MERTLHGQLRSIVIHSPHSGRSEKLSQALTYLEEVGAEVIRSISIAELDNQPPQGEIWREEGIDIAIAAGGDGLVGGVITHIAESSLPLGIVPLGTANDIARSLHLPQDVHQAANVIAQGKEVEVDIGVARPAEQAPHPASRSQKEPAVARVGLQKHGFFAHALTVGLNVQFARIATNIATRQRYGHLTYPFAALEVLRNHHALDVELEFEGLAVPEDNQARQEQVVLRSATVEEQAPLRCRALQVAVINAPIFGGKWQLSVPGASLSDHLLDIIVLEEFDFGGLSSRLAGFFSSKENGQEAASASIRVNGQEDYFAHHPAELTGIPGIHHVQARGVIITTNADPRDVTLDGEVRGLTPMYAHMADERLRVVVPG